MNRKNLFRLAVILVTAVLSVAFISCSSDDDSPNSLSGKWEARLSDGDSQGTWTFIFQDGIATYIEKWSEAGYEDDIETYTGPYTIEEDIVTMELTRAGSYSSNYTFVFKWEIKGKKLTLTPYNSRAMDYWEEPFTLSKK